MEWRKFGPLFPSEVFFFLRNQVKLNCSKVDKIICKAFLLCTIELMQLFYHLEVGQLFWNIKDPSFLLFYFILTSHHTTHCLVDWKAVEIFLFGICILCWVCPWIRPETVELGSWVLTCFSYNKLTKYHYFLFSFKQFDLRKKFCLDFLMCVSVWQVSSVDYFLWIWNISNRWLLYHLLNIIRCVLAGQNQIIDVLNSQYETFALFFFPCF